MFKKSIAIIFVVSMAMVACGGGGNGGNSSTSQPVVPTTQSCTSSPVASYEKISGTTGLEVTPVSPVLEYPIAPSCVAKYTAINLPTGLVIDQTTGKLSGLVNSVASGVFTVSLSVNGTTASTSKEIPYNFIAPVVTACGPAGYANSTVAYADLLGTVNAVLVPETPVLTPALPAGCTASFSAARLPAGLSLNPRTGVISGTPTSPGSGNIVISLAIPTYPTSNSPAFAYTVSPAVSLPSLSAPQPGSVAALAPATPEGLWKKGLPFYYSTFIASDGTYASVGLVVNIFGSLNYSNGSLWSFNSGAFELGYFYAPIVSSLGAYVSQKSFDGKYSTSGATPTTSVDIGSYSYANALAIDSIADLAGTYVSEKTKFVINSAGNLSGSYTSSGAKCELTGNVSSKDAGTKKNIFVLSVASNGGGCGLLATTYSGLAARNVVTSGGGYQYSLPFLVKTIANNATWFDEPVRK